MDGPFTRRAVMAAAGGLAASAFAPSGLKLSTVTKRDLWRRSAGPQLRGAVFVQRRVYPELDGPTFLGSGPFGPPIADFALDQLAELGGNLASWSGPGLFSETEPFGLDAAVEDHMAAWLDQCQARGLYTTLCFRSGPGRSAFAFHPDQTWYPENLYDDSLWQSQDKQAAWVMMIAETLRRFGAHPALAGIVPLEEPNAADLGRAEVWPSMAAAMARQFEGGAHGTSTPLLFSPDRWARVEAASSLREAIGGDHPMVLHDYEPWAYTHQTAASPLPYDRLTMEAAGFPSLAGDWSVLEFGAVRSAPSAERFLEDRIDLWEGLGANWAIFRWSSGWHEYERAEGSMTVSEDPRLRSILRRAFEKNTMRPET